MALLNRDPFDPLKPPLNAGTNPYLNLIREGVDAGRLPIYYGPRLRELRGMWRQNFANNSTPVDDLILEVGCHFGKSICQLASEFPDTGFIGADITFKRVYKTIKKAAQLPNVVTTLVNAKFIGRIFDHHELDGVIIFFPDPWTKAKKAKHRLMDLDFLIQVKSVMKPGGFLWFKTDQLAYFEMVSEHCKAAQFKLAEVVPKYAGKPATSSFETLFLKQQRPIYEAIWLS